MQEQTNVNFNCDVLNMEYLEVVSFNMRYISYTRLISSAMQWKPAMMTAVSK